MNGDIVAVSFVTFFLVVAVGLGLFVWKVKRDLRREDEERDRKYGRKK
jgi:hypothetical protein